MLAGHGMRPKQHFLMPMQSSDSPSNEGVSQIISYLRKSPEVDEVLVCGTLERCSQLIKLLSPLRDLPVTVSFLPTGPSAQILQRPSNQLGDMTCIELQRQPLNTIELALKRVVDVLFAAFGLVVLFPLMTLTALMIKLDSPGPVLFRQRRRGFNGEQFQILKFRTMRVLEDGDKVVQATRLDDRVTPLGYWLRRTSIDELPQLWNVLTGSMSLVGPRPHAISHDNEFDKMVRHYAVRHHVKPGLTGWAQVHGCRGPTPTPADVQRRVQFDLWYIDNWSLRIDCLIILRTAMEVLRARNAY
jgi:putative colanic acid biosynthesis UDP-glucose lipid carrier transferase